MIKRVLVIDDNEMVRKSFVLALEDTGFQIETAKSGEEGIEKVQAAKYDLIFLDLKMPGLDGVATLRELRKIDLDVPIYIVTAFHAEFLGKLKSAAKDGLDFQILEKPIGRDQIIYLANGLLEGAMECHPRGEQDV